MKEFIEYAMEINGLKKVGEKESSERVCPLSLPPFHQVIPTVQLPYPPISLTPAPALIALPPSKPRTPFSSSKR